MKPSSMTPRQRMLAALDRQQPDLPPCSFMLYKGLLSRSSSYLDFIQKQLDLGLDAFVQLPPRPPKVTSDSYNLHGLPVSFHTSVKVREWKETIPGERWPVMFKEYQTPAGALRAEVYQDAEWPYGDHVPFLDDYIETRSRRFIIQGMPDLPAFEYLLAPPSPAEINAFREEAQPVLNFARQHDLLVAGGWGVGADMVGWVYGLEKMIYAGYEKPEFMHALLEKIAAWNRQRMTVVLEAGIDLYIKRAWYENCDFWTPAAWQKYIAPILKQDADLAHNSGARFGYFVTAGCMKILDQIAACGVDVLIGVDPLEFDLEQTKQKLSGKVCLWGGVNGHLTVELGSPDDVRREVRQALDVLAPGGGFILSPVDNVREDSPAIRANVQALIAAWQEAASA